jgi:tRNA-splicing ligase RtcB
MVRTKSRTEAKKRFTVVDQVNAMHGVECRKNIDAVMEAQRDLVEVVHTLKQVVCVKG